MFLDISEAEIRSLSRITNVDSSGNSAKRDEKMDTEGCCAGAFSSMSLFFKLSSNYLIYLSY